MTSVMALVNVLADVIVLANVMVLAVSRGRKCLKSFSVDSVFAWIKS